MKNRIMSGIAAMLMALGLSVSIGAAPAQAAFGGYCATNSICLYQWTGYGAQVAGDRWQSSFYNIIQNHGGCINIYNAAWDNGTAVNNNSGSMMWVAGTGYSNYTVRVFDWENCNGSGLNRYMGYVGTNGTYNFDNLGNYTFNNPYASSTTLYHRITSIMVRDPLG